MAVHDSPIHFDIRQTVDASFAHHTNHKRPPTLHEDYHCYQTIRKKANLPQEHSSPSTIKKLPVTLSQSITQRKNFDSSPSYPHSISPRPLRQKYANLIGEVDKGELPLQVRLLLRVHSKLDEHLLYLKTNRGKRLGQFYKSLRKNLYQGNQFIIELLHIKQILYIDSSLYICSRQKDNNNSYDILINLPQNADLYERRLTFRENVINWLKGPGNNKQARIPAYKFPFQQEIELNNAKIQLKRKECSQMKVQNEVIAKTANLFNNSFEFKQQLLKKIAERQAKNKQKMKGTNQKRYGKAEILRVLDGLFQIYIAKKVLNMFRATVLNSMSRVLLIRDEFISEILDIIAKDSSGFLKIKEHRSGPILQIQTTLFKNCRQNMNKIQV